MEAKKLKLLFWAIVILLFFPLIQQLSGIIKVKPLNGAIAETAKPIASIQKWFEGDFQQESESYLNEKFGFRNYFIRLNNQVTYSLYNKARANGVIIGKNNYLFEQSYINAFYGRDFVGKDSIDSVLSRVQFLQTILAKKNIKLVLVLNPGKASYYPQYIPDYLKSTKTITNYEYYSQKYKQLNLNVLDFRSYFITNKNSFPYPLFPKCGIHWSTYCEILAKDSLMKYIGAIQKTQVPDIIIDSIKVAKGNLFRDADIKNGMNLLVGPDCGELAYPYYHVIEKDRTKLNTLVIADSFYWGIYGRDDITQLFKINQFWYYYNELYIGGGLRYPENIDLKKEIEKQDIIIIMATESTLPKFGWGFIEAAYSLYKSEKPN